jgi:predicted ribosomally synthesized peptide with SipW-like signal peptide
MNKKILASVLVIGMLALAMGYGTYSYFSSTKTAGISITAGNMDLWLSKDGGSTWYNDLTFGFPDDWAPGDSYTVTVWLTNNGKSGAKFLEVRGRDPDGGPDGWKLADKINITDMAVTFSSGSVWSGLGMYNYFVNVYDTSGPSARANDDGYWTLGEFPNSWTMKFWEEDCAPTAATVDYLKANQGNIQAFKMTFHFDEDADYTYQNIYFNFNLKFTITDDPAILHWAGESHGYVE